VPKLWSSTIETHRREVRDAILETTAALVAERGLRAVTMSEIAEKAGIGRATLYKYFADVEAILDAWHQRQLMAHLAQLGQVSEQSGPPFERLEGVLQAYGLIQHQHQGGEHEARLHQGEHVAHAKHHLTELVRDLIAECAKAGTVRTDVAPGELASYCLHALGAAGQLPSKPAVRRLVSVILGGLAPPRRGR
jgi:AcrR family transcriptional regulator